MVNKQTSPSLAGWNRFWVHNMDPVLEQQLNKSAQAGAPLGRENMDIKVLAGRFPND